MSMRPLPALSLLALLTALGCASSNASSPEAITRVDISSSEGLLGVTELRTSAGVAAHTLPAPPDSVWMALPRVYEMLEIPGAGTTPDQTMFGARDFRPRRIEGKRLSTFIDCGMGPTATPKADEYEIRMTLVTRLVPAAEEGTRMETTLQASGKPRATAGNPVSCQSNGRLERRVADLVAWVLLSGN
jgi:hypothetical protein